MATKKKTKRPETAMYFNELVAVGKNQVYLGGHLYSNDEINVRATRFRGYENGAWKKKGDMNGIVCGMVAFYNPDRRLWALSATGLVREYIPTGERDTAREETIPVREMGHLFALKRIGAALYACGANRQVFRRGERGWQPFDDGIYAPSTPAKSFFTALDGCTENDIYCVGAGGELAHYDGQVWRTLESPTNYNLFTVLCVSEEEIYFGGNGGTLFRGNRRGWTSIGLIDKEESFHGLAKFQGKIYAATISGLWVVEAGGLAPVNTRLAGKLNFYRLSATETDLWASSGKTDIYHYDGSRWERVVCPDNVG